MGIGQTIEAVDLYMMSTFPGKILHITTNQGVILELGPERNNKYAWAHLYIETKKNFDTSGDFKAIGFNVRYRCHHYGNTIEEVLEKTRVPSTVEKIIS